MKKASRNFLENKALQRLVTNCSMCKAKAQYLIIRPVQTAKAAELFHIYCSSCQGSLVALIFSTGSMVSSIGLITDLSSDDALRLQNAEEITEDDLIDLHQSLVTRYSTKQLLQHLQ